MYIFDVILKITKMENGDFQTLCYSNTKGTENYYAEPNLSLAYFSPKSNLSTAHVW